MARNKKSHAFLFRVFLTCWLIFSLPCSSPADLGTDPFFIMGDGKVHIRNPRTGQEAQATLLNSDRSLNEAGFRAVDKVFGFPANENGEHISPRLIFMLDYFSDLVAPGKVINLESGYRSPEYNNSLRNRGGNVAKTSLHQDGMALDFNIEGVKGKELWDIIRSKDCCGVGNYGGANVHLDSAKPRFWEASTSKVKTGVSDYNRRIYLTTDLDRYPVGGKVRLSLVSVSDFGFGIKPSVAIVDDGEGDRVAGTTRILSRDEKEECIMVRDRESAHSIYINLPGNLREGKYRVRIEYCNKPFEQMPPNTLSNRIEIKAPTP